MKQEAMGQTRAAGHIRDNINHRIAPGLCGALVACVIAAMPSDAAGAIYQYIDKAGTIHFTNVPTDPRFQQIKRDYLRLAPRLSRKALEQAIARYSRQQRLDPALIRAVIKAESDFNPRALSKAGAMGLMQLMPNTAAAWNVRDPYNPLDNIRGGARHLRYLLDRFYGNLPLALAAYNAGESRVEQHQRIPPIRETRRYVRKVLGFYRAYLSHKPSASPLDGQKPSTVGHQ